MEHELNQLNQPVGLLVENWKPPCLPVRTIMNGAYCRLVPLDSQSHAEELYAANMLDTQGLCWTYLYDGPFENFNEYRNWLKNCSLRNDAIFYAIIDHSTNKAVGVASYLRIDPNMGSIEVGNINYSPLLKNKTAATEAMILMMTYAFDLGYRRYEWKCNALNAPSRAAAQRLGFTFEGLFRQAVIVKGRNRDTAWYSIIDKDWPALKEIYANWLSPSNFDKEGNQKLKLSALTFAHLKPQQ